MYWVIKMSDEKIELNKDSLAKLFALAGMEMPDNVDEEQIAKLQENLKKKQTPNVVEKIEETPKTINIINEYLKGGEEQRRPKTVLIIDDLGVIVYQLELLFKKMGFEVTTSNRVNDCIAKFKKKDFGYVIMDLFLPTEKEGFLLLDELKKLVLLCKLDTKIVVMTASSKADYKINCKNRGADYYIEKTQGWQNELIEYCK